MEIALQITRGRTEDAKDLLSLTYEIIADKGDEYMSERMEYIKDWVALTMYRNYDSNTSPYHYLYRKHKSETQKEEWVYTYLLEKEDSPEYKNYIEESISEVDSKRTTLSLEENQVLQIYYYHTHYQPEHTKEKNGIDPKTGYYKNKKVTVRATAKEIGVSQDTFAKTKREALNKLRDESDNNE